MIGSLQQHNIEWLNANSQRAYPLTEAATKLDTTGSFKIPDDLILALYFPVHAGVAVEPEKFYVKNVTVFATGVNVTIGYDDGSEFPTVASAAVPLAGHTEYRSYALPGAGEFDDSVGKVVFGQPSAIKGLPPGSYDFAPAAGRLDVDCIRPVIRGVTSVVLVNNGERSEKLTGVIELNAGSNIRLSVAAAGAVNTVRIDAIKGEGLTRDCVCDDATDGPCIKTINGIPPDDNGNFIIQGDDCLIPQGITNGVKLVDQCSKPCCGCQELEAVTRDLERFGSAATSLENYLNRLEGSVNRMNLTVLGSRLNDRGCREC